MTTIKSVEFRREREHTWRELERLVEQVERHGLASLGAEQLERLPVLYRATLSSLSVARAVSLDRNVLDYLESLGARAYFCVYGRSRPLSATLSDFVLSVFPSRVRAFRQPAALALLLLLAGVAVGFELTRRDPERFYTFVSTDLAAGRSPAASTADLRQALYDRGGAADALVAFAMFLFTHNARVGLGAAALGFVFGLPTLWLVFWNGALLGAFAALYTSRGLGLEFWAWVLPHGVTELSAVVLCGGAGLALADALLFPGRHGRLEHLAHQGRQVGALVIGSVGMLFLAGLVEGLFRQRVMEVEARLALALLSAVVWALYFTLAGRGQAR